MADEREEHEAKERHARTMALLQDLRGDTHYRMDEIINRHYNVNMDDLSEERATRAEIRASLVSLQRRIDQTLNSLR